MTSEADALLAWHQALAAAGLVPSRFEWTQHLRFPKELYVGTLAAELDPFHVGHRHKGRTLSGELRLVTVMDRLVVSVQAIGTTPTDHVQRIADWMVGRRPRQLRAPAPLLTKAGEPGIDPRPARAMGYHHKHGAQIRRVGALRWHVPTSDGGAKYIVDFSDNQRSCTCMDFERGHTCKHILALLIHSKTQIKS